MEGVLTVVALFALAGAMIWHARRVELASRRQAARSFHADLTHVTILLNTMRGILQQQKDLARQINEHLDRKATAIRQLADVAAENLDKLRETKRHVAEELEEARVDLAALERQIQYLREHAERPAAPGTPEEPAPAPPSKAPAKPRNAARKGGRAAKAADADDAPFEAVAPVEAPPAAPPVPEPATVPVEPFAAPAGPLQAFDEPSELPIEYVESSREALRSLLGLDPPLAAEPREALAAAPFAAPANGTVSAPLQARVQEYHDAGMTVPQIARELGLGRGEVRLILNLRKGH